MNRFLRVLAVGVLAGLCVAGPRPGDASAADKEQAALTGHTGDVYSVAFSPDGKTLASAGWDRRIKLWDVATGKDRESFEVPNLPKFSTVAVYAVAYSPDGKMLAAGSQDRIVRLWDVSSKK
ncbi:MAG: hypothetical protein JWO38_5969 [Gemmataceae bacterium]|nr:hypothetical protein [Gemmataceae bacterium]